MTNAMVRAEDAADLWRRCRDNEAVFVTLEVWFATLVMQTQLDWYSGPLVVAVCASSTTSPAAAPA